MIWKSGSGPPTYTRSSDTLTILAYFRFFRSARWGPSEVEGGGKCLCGANRITSATSGGGSPRLSGRIESIQLLQESTTSAEQYQVDCLPKWVRQHPPNTKCRHATPQWLRERRHTAEQNTTCKLPLAEGQSRHPDGVLGQPTHPIYQTRPIQVRPNPSSTTPQLRK